MESGQYSGGVYSFHTRYIRWTAFFHCNACKKGICATIEGDNDISRPLQFTSAIENEPRYKVLKIYPQEPPLGAPPNVSTNVAAAFIDGKDNLRRKRWNPAGIMFRRTIEIGLLIFVRELDATRELEKEFKTVRVLKEKIDWVAAKGWIAPSLKEWAHEIRSIGNEVGHEEDGITEQEAKDCEIFCEALLTYLFTLPEMIKKRKSQTAGTS